MSAFVPTTIPPALATRKSSSASLAPSPSPSALSSAAAPVLTPPTSSSSNTIAQQQQVQQSQQQWQPATQPTTVARPMHAFTHAPGPAPPPGAGAAPVTVVWFRDDLRVHDHPALHAAATSVRRARVAALLLRPPQPSQFWLAAARDLRDRLRSLGCELHVRALDLDRESVVTHHYNSAPVSASATPSFSAPSFASPATTTLTTTTPPAPAPLTLTPSAPHAQQRPKAQLQHGFQSYSEQQLAGATARAVVAFAVDEAGASRVHFHRAVERGPVAAERAATAELRRRGVAVWAGWSGSLREPDALPFAIADAPDDCDDFERAVKAVPVGEPLPVPRRVAGVASLPSGEELLRVASVPTLQLQQQQRKGAAGDGRGRGGGGGGDGGGGGGETAGLARVHEYCRGGAGLVGANAAAPRAQQGAPSARTIDTKFGRLGPFLAAGCVSPRRLWAEVRAGMDERTLRRFCAELELVLRDYVRIVTLKRGGVCPA